MPVNLTRDMAAALERALNDRSPCLVATASRDGLPDVSYRGSVMVLDDEHLAFWERAKGETLDNLLENPKVCVLYRNAETRQGWRFYGEADVLTDGALRLEIMARVNAFELSQDPERTGFAVRIRVGRVRERNQTIMQRD